MDFLYRPFLLDLDSNVAFSRMGFVDDTSAKVLIRAPYITDVRLDYRMDDSSGWKTGEVQSLSKDNDYTATYRLLGLGPDTQYHYRTNTSHSGTFRTAPVNPKSWSIIASSCIKPGFPYDPVGHPLRIRGLEHLSRYIQTRRTEFMLFLGDFIYVDLPLNLGQKKEDYRRAYRQVYASPSWSESLWSLPFLHTYDNHEFENDWAGYTSGIFDDAVEPFNTYQGQANPDSAVAGHAYFTFNKGDVSFFVLDTRRYRDPQSVPDGAHKTMLGANQFEALLSWIQATKGIKVVVSSVPFTNNWRGPEAYDSWAGYQYERQVILSHMWANNGGIIISGDRHEHATTEFPSPEGKAKVVELSTSPLSQFYQPFRRTYQQFEESDVEVFSHPKGTSKFGIFHFDTFNETRRVIFELIVDGTEIWRTSVDFPPH